MLINNILISSQLDVKAYRQSKEELNFSDLLQTEIKQFNNRYPTRQVPTDIESDVMLNGDALLLKLLVSNLLADLLYAVADPRIRLQGRKR